MKFDADMMQKVGIATSALGLGMWLLGTLEKQRTPKPCALAYEWWWAA